YNFSRGITHYTSVEEYGALPSYFLSLLRNSRSSAVTDASYFLELIDRDISGANITRGDNHDEEGRFFFFGEMGRVNTDLKELVGIQGKSYALIIANSDYENAKADPITTQVRALAEELSDQNGFEVELLLNQSKREIVKKIADYALGFQKGRLPRDGQLFIYITGFVSEGLERYLTADPSDNLETAGLDLEVDIGNPLERINCQHILAIGDLIEIRNAGESANGAIAPTMEQLPSGTFQMGDTFNDHPDQEDAVDEYPVHEVYISGFEMGKYEVSFAEYDAFCEATGKQKPNDNGWGRDQQPVINITWYDAVSYCNWLSVQEGLEPVYDVRNREFNDAWKNNGYNVDVRGQQVVVNWNRNGYRLPTEAEWEYAARAGSPKARYGELDAIAWHPGNSERRT
ncbi:MAG: SUMF1/EgtB/PvdO family nonheme iron enzyme, partial [Bacteroidota bacterium]